ncbi:hypothetical protein [Stappia sediminis]|nr:hypothetical protein [Stappia sediminis]
MSLSYKSIAERAPEFFGARIADRKAAEAVCARLNEAMSELLRTIEHETALVREGKLAEAGELQPLKADLISIYMRGMTYVRDNSVALGNLAPGAVEALHLKHGEFQPILRINLAVLATAREVADGLLRKVAEGAGAKSSAKTYGPNGSKPEKPKPIDGLTVNQSL